MPKGTRHPVPYAEITIGNWYQARFEFKVDDKIAEPSTGSLIRTRNKSHRVFVLAKIPDTRNASQGRAICLFLTSFGGHVDLGTACTSTFEQLKYLAVNSTTQLPSSPYSAIPITIRSLYGFMDFTGEYQLPITHGGDAAIMPMREAGKSNSRISSPEWALEYIRRLKIGWMTWLLYEHEDEAKWVETAKAITAEYREKVDEAEVEAVSVALEAGPSGGQGVGTKRVLSDDRDNGGSKGKGNAKRQPSGSRWLDGNRSDEDQVSEFEDSGIHDMESGCVAETTELAKPHVHHHAVAALFPVLVSVALYHLGDDEEEIDGEVDRGLLDALFRPIK